MSRRSGSKGDGALLVGGAIGAGLAALVFWSVAKSKDASARPLLPLPRPLPAPRPAPPPPASYASGWGTSGWSVGQVADCFDAVKNMEVCTAVAEALRSQNDIDWLRGFSSRLLNDGFPMAANAIMAKADRLSEGDIAPSDQS